MRTTWTFSWLLLLGALGCDAQVSPDYPGQPLVTLTGEVTSSSSALPLPQVEVGLLWQRSTSPDACDEDLATKASVQGEFPAQFVLRLYHPAPEAALQSLRAGEVRFARAIAAVLPVGVAVQPNVNGTAVAFSCVTSVAYAVDTVHWFLYLEQDVPANSLTAWWLGGALPAGYHLLNVLATSQACLAPTQVAACVTELGQLGVQDVPLTPGAQGEATSYCTAAYRLQAAPFSEGITLNIGGALTPTVAPCP